MRQRKPITFSIAPESFALVVGWTKRPPYPTQSDVADAALRAFGELSPHDQERRILAMRETKPKKPRRNGKQ